jgi:hypothetical protein
VDLIDEDIEEIADDEEGTAGEGDFENDGFDEIEDDDEED